MTSLNSCSGPAAAAILPGLPMTPSAGVGFADMPGFCAEPAASTHSLPFVAHVPGNPALGQYAASTPRVSSDEVVANLIPPEPSFRVWRLDRAEATDSFAPADDDTDAIQAEEPEVAGEPGAIDVVPFEILGRAVSLPPPTFEPRQAPACPPSDRPKNSVTDIPLHARTITEEAGPARIDAAAIAEGSALDGPAASVDHVSTDSKNLRASTALPPTSPVALSATAVTTERSDFGAVSAAAEKFAAVSKSPADGVRAAAGNRADNKFLKSYDQLDVNPTKAHGIGRARSAADMQATFDPIPRQTSFAPTLAAGVMNEATAPVVAMAPAFPAVTISHTASAEIFERREVSPPATDATSVVREVAELTHDFRMSERSSVEVKFNFEDEKELSVRLAYRDGDVHTTFRTDSADLRAALGREWPGYAASVAQEPRSYRVADPVFTASNSFSDSAQGRDSGSAADGEARDRQQSAHRDQSDSPRSATHFHGLRSHVPVLGHRISADRLLHAFA